MDSDLLEILGTCLLALFASTVLVYKMRDNVWCQMWLASLRQKFQNKLTLKPAFAEQAPEWTKKPLPVFHELQERQFKARTEQRANIIAYRFEWEKAVVVHLPERTRAPSRFDSVRRRRDQSITKHSQRIRSASAQRAPRII